MSTVSVSVNIEVGSGAIGATGGSSSPENILYNPANPAAPNA